MFWVLEAPGGGTIAIQGTLHLGTDELYPLHGTVLDSLAAAETVVAELSPGALDRVQGLVLDRMAGSVLPDRKTLYELLPAADVATIEGVMGRDMFRRLSGFLPWVAYSVMDQYSAGSSGLDGSLGVDVALYSAAAELGKTVSGLETAEFQLDVLTGPALELQLLLLRDNAREYRERPQALRELYEAYLSDDRRALARLMADSMERSERFAPELARWNDALFGSRNAEWAGKIAALAAGGKDVFLFAGVGHFLGPGSVIELLEARGFRLLR